MSLIVKLSGINKIYDQGEGLKFQALKNVSLKVFKGDFIAVIGPSGSGKSTLMHILGLLDHPTSGIYELNGQDVSKLSENELAKIRNRKIGFVFQSFNLLARTSAIENTALPLIYSGVKPAERLEKAKEVLSQVGLADKLYSKPNQLSGGQQQRVAIARSLINNPELILADEPTGNLDTKTAGEIMGILKKLNEQGSSSSKEGRTIILITHETDIAKHAKKIIRLKDGQII